MEKTAVRAMRRRTVIIIIIIIIIRKIMIIITTKLIIIVLDSFQTGSGQTGSSQKKFTFTMINVQLHGQIYGMCGNMHRNRGIMYGICGKLCVIKRIMAI